MAKYESDSCQRCKQLFVCNPYNIANCNCGQVELSYEETQFISKQFEACVCNKCLLELKYEYYLTHNHNKNN